MKIFRSLMLALLVLITSPTHAALINLMPSDSDVFTGEYFDVEVRITDLQPGEVVFIMDITALFDPTVLNLMGISFGSGLGGVDDSYQAHNGNSLYENSFLDNVALEALQRSAFTLFTLNFRAISPSLASVIGLEINPVGLLNYELEDIAAEISAATITIEQRAQTVSAPSNLPLLLLALTSLAIWRRTRHSG